MIKLYLVPGRSCLTPYLSHREVLLAGERRYSWHGGAILGHRRSSARDGDDEPLG